MGGFGALSDMGEHIGSPLRRRRGGMNYDFHLMAWGSVEVGTIFSSIYLFWSISLLSFNSFLKSQLAHSINFECSSESTNILSSLPQEGQIAPAINAFFIIQPTSNRVSSVYRAPIKIQNVLVMHLLLAVFHGMLQTSQQAARNHLFQECIL